MKGLASRSKTSDEPATGPETRDALYVALIGVIIAIVLTWLGIPGPSPQAFRLQMAQASAGAAGHLLENNIALIVAETTGAATQPVILQALQSRQTDLAKSLSYLPGLVDAYLISKGQAALDDQRASPVNYVALDLIRQVEQGHTPGIEAQKVGERWVIYSLAPVRAAPDGPLLGTLLLSFDLKRILVDLDNGPPEFGRLTLTQHFPEGQPQVLFDRGIGAVEQQYPMSAGAPFWSLMFTPGSAYLAPFPWRSLIFFSLAVLAAFAGIWLALKTVAKRLRTQVAGDAHQLTQLIQELSGGKAVKAFSLSLPELNAVATSLARLSLQGGRHGAPAVQTTSSAQAPARFEPRGSALSESLLDEPETLELDDLVDEPMESHTAMNSQAQVAPRFPESIFRAYDIRGVVGKTLTVETAYWVGRAIGSQSLAQGEANVAVGRDGRLSGPMLVQQLIQGLADSGCHVSDVGLVPTPALYYAANILAGKSGVMLTGSHNPADYNGFKIVIAGDTLANEQIQALHQRLKTNDLSSGKGSVEKVEILDRYFQQIKQDIALAKKLKVVVDCGNGAAGVIAPQLIEALGCEVIPLFCEVDGNFPNHHPDPGKPENLADLIAKVKETGADLGLAFDGDGDRVGVVTNTGTIVYPDRLLMLFAKDVVSRNPGADIIFDVKCTRRLSPLITRYGGRPVMWKTGHSLIKKKMKLTGALLAGEMSGHIFFKERWFGFDDGIYAAARLLEILSQEKNSAEDLFAAFPDDISTPELNIHVTDEGKFSIIDALQSDAQWGEANLTTIDGVRVDYPKGWGLVRASNTTPVLVLRFEADDQAELERIQDVFRAELKKIAPDLQLPF